MNDMRMTLRQTISFILLSVLCLGAKFTEAKTLSLKVGTGSITGLYYPTGGVICRMIQQDTDMQCKVLNTGGSVDNAERLRANTIQLAIIQSDIQYDAFHGKGKFQKDPLKNLTALFSLYSEPLTIVTRQDTDIKTIEQLAGKRVDIGNPGSGDRNTMELLLEEMGWGHTQFSQISELPGAQRSRALCNKKIDAFIYMVGHPSNIMREVTDSCLVRFVAIPEKLSESFTKKYPYYTTTQIPARLYRGVNTPVSSVGVSATFVTLNSLSTEAAYNITKSVFTQLPQFKQLNPAYQQLTPQGMAHDALSVPIHPGAMRYYQEVGLHPKAQ